MYLLRPINYQINWIKMKILNENDFCSISDKCYLNFLRSTFLMVPIKSSKLLITWIEAQFRGHSWICVLQLLFCKSLFVKIFIASISCWRRFLEEKTIAVEIVISIRSWIFIISFGNLTQKISKTLMFCALRRYSNFWIKKKIIWKINFNYTNIFVQV